MSDVPRDDYGQYDGEWTERESKLLVILEEVSNTDVNGDKTLTAYMADIIEVFE